VWIGTVTCQGLIENQPQRSNIVYTYDVGIYKRNTKKKNKKKKRTKPVLPLKRFRYMN